VSINGFDPLGSLEDRVDQENVVRDIDAKKKFAEHISLLFAGKLVAIMRRNFF
jgi:hypothetical protein